MSLGARFLARQFAQPSGWIGRLLIAPWLDRISRPMNRLILAELDLQHDDRVLEIGFGGGGLLAAIAGATAGRVDAVDPSAAMVGRARRRFRRFRRVHLHRASVESLPLGDGEVDKAVSAHNIYFWSDPAKGMAELARVVRLGGRLVIAFEPPESLRKWPGHRFGFRLLSAGEIRALMAEAGFGDLRIVEGRGRKPDLFCCLTGERIEAEAAP